MIVLISGKQGSGKTTLAESLEEHLRFRFNKKCYQHRFANVIYEMHDECRMILRSYGIEPKPEKDGELLQFLGTNWGRKNYGDNVWAKCTRSAVDKILKASPNTVHIISDCRFRNEFSFFPDALRVRLTCSKEVRKARCESWRENDTHPSEVDLDGFEDRFDLVLDTGIYNVGHCVDLILHKILNNTFIEKRTLDEPEETKIQLS